MNFPDRVCLVVQPVDFRCGINRLSLVVQSHHRACDGTYYAFCNRRRSLLKLLVWDGNGAWLWLRRLHQGLFVWPESEDPLCWLTLAQWQWLIAGVDWQRLDKEPPSDWQV